MLPHVVTWTRCLLCCAIVLPLSLHAESLALAEHGRWQALLHINPGATLRDRGQSYVSDPSFFFAEEGRTDPAAELRATQQAMTPADSDARCRFPARYRYLAEGLGWHDADPFAHCDEYLKWRESVQASRAVLVFPAAYLNSPSSMFGHTLLRLDQGDDAAVWLSWAVNFGALATEDDNSLFYVYRGIAGGYPGQFSLVPYLQKIQEYSHLENRDMWEYALNLEQEEIDWMIDHLWELRGLSFDYYFFDENCSFRLLELIEVARPGQGLLDDFRLVEIPVETVRNLTSSGFVEGRHYRPSKAVEISAMADSLSVPQQRLALALADDPDVADQAVFKQYPPHIQANMLDLAYRHLRQQQRRRSRDGDAAQRSLALLTRRNAIDSPATLDVATPVAPEKGHGTQMFALSGGRYDAQGFGQITYRMTYHDWLDNRPGFLTGAHIEALKIDLRQRERESLTLEELKLVSIRSIAPRTRFASPLSWFVEGGLERTLVQRPRLTRYLHGGAGGSWSLGLLQPYLLASARVESNSGFDQRFNAGLGAEAGVLVHWRHWSGLVHSRGHYFDNDAYRHVHGIGVQRRLSKQQGLRLTLEREAERGNDVLEARLEWRLYFD